MNNPMALETSSKKRRSLFSNFRGLAQWAHQAAIPARKENDETPANDEAHDSDKEYDRILRVTVDADLCKYCRKLAVDLLVDPTQFGPGWKTIYSGYNFLTYLKEHHDGKVCSLMKSANAGCELCALIVGVIQSKEKNVDPDCRYYIFIWSTFPKTGVFLTCLGDVSRFVSDHNVSHSEAIELRWYRKNGSDTHWQNVNRHDMFRKKTRFREWPPLDTWPNQFPGSVEAINRAQRWLFGCIYNHEHCSRPKYGLPKRILDLGSSKNFDRVALYLSRGENVVYATLSYSWGLSLPLTTTTLNLDKHCEGMSLEAFPRTLKDAIYIARCLNFRYLWIDALCILQDDAKDWAQQATLMTEIYQGSTLNISALSSHDCNSGMLTSFQDHSLRIGTYFHPANDSGQGDIFVGPPRNYPRIEEKHLFTRGWVFQERLVSVASLHYSDEGIIWECASKLNTEDLDRHISSNSKSEWVSLTRRKLQAPSYLGIPKSNMSKDEEDSYRFWNNLVSSFSGLDLTQEQDKLPAMAGIARSLATKFQLNYVAGLWREDFPSALLWERNHLTKSLTRPREYRAPSWSWASLNGSLNYTHYGISTNDLQLDLQILEIHADEVLPGTFGKVRGGKIEATGFLQEIVADRSVLTSFSNLPFQGCGVVEGVVANVKVTCQLDENPESADAHQQCWCLRVGAFNNDGRSSVAFLLLESTDARENQFRRIGTAETVVWGEDADQAVDYDIFVSGRRLRFTLV